MKKSNFSYRLIKASWGIAIDLFAEYTSKDNATENFKHEDTILIGPGLWGLTLCKNLSNDEINFVWSGLRHIHDLIIKNTPFKNDTLIIIHSIEFNYCDYQPEGLQAAIIGWAAKAFGFQEPEIKATFNKIENKYIFDFSGAGK